MAHLVTLATCNLNQWALDFEGNRDRIIESIRLAREAGAKFRTGPELEVPGYGCLDHFLESDTFLHSWQVVCEILKHPDCQDIIVDVGLPILHRGVRYNCRVIMHNGKILMMRPKLWLANDGNYREMRYFTPWPAHRTEEHTLPEFVSEIVGQDKVPFGDLTLSLGDTTLGFETCEELFTPHSPHIDMALAGVEIFTNSSGSHHELRKLTTRLNLIIEATRKCGGVYMYANQRGCDGDRLYYDGSALIVVNGQVVAQGEQFGLKDVDVITATVDLTEVRSYRSAPSFGMQSISESPYDSVSTDIRLKPLGVVSRDRQATSPFDKPRIYDPEEEIALGPACWLWDYLRRSHMAGYFVPLSGGIDSCATSLIVFSMCKLVYEECQRGKDANPQVLADARRLANKDDSWIPASPQEFCGLVFHTAYMGTENSSAETRQRAKDLSKSIGSYHLDFNIDTCVSAMVTLFKTVCNHVPKFKVHGGSNRENLALQNIQARLRMVTAYMFALLLPWVRGVPGSLLVLGSANVDEALRGYLTKYDCSSADINPIGSISKADLVRFVDWSRVSFNLPVLESFVNATPTAELEPITSDYVQSDEADMGLTYEEMSVLGKLRKVSKLGPYSTFVKLSHEWSDIGLENVAEKVKRFFYYYAINRHKMTVLTPAYHAENYSPDDNRFDLRPFLIRPFPWAFGLIDAYVSDKKATPQTE